MAGAALAGVLAPEAARAQVGPPAPAAGYTYQGFDAPGSAVFNEKGFLFRDTYATGVNDAGLVTGSYYDAVLREHAYLYDTRAGTFSALDVPGAAVGAGATGVNAAGEVVGTYSDGSGPNGHYGFLRGPTGAFTRLAIPGAEETDPTGINAAGAVVGTYYDALGSTHGFLYAGGTYTTFDAPGAATFGGTHAQGINAAGEVVGYYGVAALARGFVYANGAFTTVDAPGADDTQLFGINDAGVLTGTAHYQSGLVGFLDDHGAFASLAVPGTYEVFQTSINDAGVVAGWYDVNYDNGGVGGSRGFLATPAGGPATTAPEPAAVVLLGVGLLGIAGAAARRARA